MLDENNLCVVWRFEAEVKTLDSLVERRSAWKELFMNYV